MASNNLGLIMIILEGPDNSGKTTLANVINEAIGLPIVHPGGAPKNELEELRCLKQQFEDAKRNIIQDRVTCISQSVFNIFRENSKCNPIYGTYLRQMLSTEFCFIVYCRPPIDKMLEFNNHEIKLHDTPEHIQLVEHNQKFIIGAYDSLFSHIPHIHYDYTSVKSKEVLGKIFDANYIYDVWYKLNLNRGPYDHR